MMPTWRTGWVVVAVGLLVGAAPGGAQIAGNVWLSVSVRDAADAHVSGLEKQDFVVRAVGEQQVVTYFSAKPAPAAVVLLIDESGSVDSARPFMQKAAMEFVAHFRRGDRINVATFVESTRLQGFVSNRSAIESSLAKLSRQKYIGDGALCTPPAGLLDSTRVYDLTSDMDARRRKLPRRGTALWDALECAANALTTDAEAIKRLVVVITDGHDTVSFGNEHSAATAIRRAGAIVYGIGVAENDASARALEAIADESGGRYLVLRRQDDLARSFRLLNEELRTHYVLGFRPANALTGNVEVSLRRAGLTARTRRTFYLGR